jgi:hypothetical protein
MKRVEVLAAGLVFLGIFLGFCFGGGRDPEASLFGAGLALEPELPPLVVPRGELVVRGHVRTATGEPAQDAFVVLERSGESSARVEPVVRAYTDEAGGFELAGLAAGTYRVVLTHPSAPPRAFEVEIPREGDIVWELSPSLPPLETLPPLERIELTGFVQVPAGLVTAQEKDLEGFEVLLRPVAETPLLAAASECRALTDRAGRFTFHALVRADYDAQVLPPWARGGTWPVLGSARLAPRESEPADLRIELRVGALAGELRETVDRPLVGALVRVTALEALDPTGKPQLWPPVVTDANGRFAVELLPPGRYLVHQRAGRAIREVEVRVESEQRCQVPTGTLELRSSEAAPGG